jgi:hypothetical protein
MTQGHHAGVRRKVTAVRTAALLDKDTASGLATTNGVDSKGFDYTEFDINLGKIVSGAVVDAWVVESNESNLGNATNVANAQNTSQQLAAAQFTTTSNDVVVTLGVYRPTKRYVGVTLKTATQNVTLVGVTASQYVSGGVIPATETAAAYQYVTMRAS